MVVSSLRLFVLVVLSLGLVNWVSANSEGDALYALRKSLKDPDNVLESWDPNLVCPCTWFHITCNADNHVTRVYLSSFPLLIALLFLDYWNFVLVDVDCKVCSFSSGFLSDFLMEFHCMLFDWINFVFWEWNHELGGDDFFCSIYLSDFFFCNLF